MKLEEKITYIEHLGIEDNEILIRHSLLKTEELILNYTNLNKLPKGLDFTHIDMAILQLEYNKSVVGVEDIDSNGGGGTVSSIQEGDTTIKMATSSDLETSIDKNKSKRIFEDKLLNDFKVSLHKYRKMRW